MIIARVNRAGYLLDQSVLKSLPVVFFTGAGSTPYGVGAAR